MQVNAWHQRYHCKRLNIHKDANLCIILYFGYVDVIIDASYGATPQLISIGWILLAIFFFLDCYLLYRVAWKLLERLIAKEIVVTVLDGFYSG